MSNASGTGVSVSRSRVALDALLQLGEGSRSGAAEVLSELFHEHPVLLGEVLARSGQPPPERLREATRIAGPWSPEPGTEGIYLRYDLLRDAWVGSVHAYGGLTERLWSARIRIEGNACSIRTCATQQEAQEVVDAALQARSWRLL